jgi:hypothetical protein
MVTSTAYRALETKLRLLKPEIVLLITRNRSINERPLKASRSKYIAGDQAKQLVDLHTGLLNSFEKRSRKGTMIFIPVSGKLAIFGSEDD